MANSSITVIRKQPGAPYYYDILPNTLEALQEAVGGYIEPVIIHGATADIVIICDEEGRLKGYEPNCIIAGIGFVGPIVIAGTCGEDFADAPFGINFMQKLTREML